MGRQYQNSITEIALVYILAAQTFLVSFHRLPYHKMGALKVLGILAASALCALGSEASEYLAKQFIACASCWLCSYFLRKGTATNSS